MSHHKGGSSTLSPLIVQNIAGHCLYERSPQPSPDRAERHRRRRHRCSYHTRLSFTSLKAEANDCSCGAERRPVADFGCSLGTCTWAAGQSQLDTPFGSMYRRLRTCMFSFVMDFFITSDYMSFDNPSEVRLSHGMVQLADLFTGHLCYSAVCLRHGPSVQRPRISLGRRISFHASCIGDQSLRHQTFASLNATSPEDRENWNISKA